MKNKTKKSALLVVLVSALLSVTAFNGILLSRNAVQAVAEEAVVTVNDGILAGEGTEENPYLINSAEELELFKASVNAGETTYNSAGVWVALAADIDLAGAVWTEGIGDGHEWSFDGNFDGKDHTIKNLTVNPYADGNKYLCGGLFGYIYGNVTIKNLVLENVTVTATAEGHNVGALVGFANNNGGKANISNITVKGDVKIDAPGAYGVGAIVGYSYRAMGTIADCVVDANAGSYINGHSFVGGITGYSYTDAILNNCTVKNVALNATSYSVGGIVGVVNGNNTVSDCVVENITVAGQANVGYVVGAIGSSSVVVENCSTSEALPVVGGNYGDNMAAEAKVGNTYYAKFATAFAAMQSNDVITLLADVTLTEDITVTATMIIDGVNLAANEGVTVTNNGTIEVWGEVTLTIATFTGNSIDLMEGAILNNSNVNGAAYVGGNVTFRGDNVFTMLTDYGDYYSSETPSKWTVEEGASLTLTKNDRYGLGYGDQVTIFGTLEDALNARASLTDADASLNMYGGLVGMTNSASPNAVNKFTAENAYLIFGVKGDKSFGNKPGSYYSTYEISIKNSVVTANGFKFYEDKGTSNVVFVDSDLYVNGVLMTNDASSTFTFENSVVCSKATSNGSDDKNQNAGVLNLINTTFTYSAAFTNVGTVNLDANSKLTAPSIAGNGTIIIDASKMVGAEAQVITANMSGFTGTIEVIGAANYEITDSGVILTRNLAGAGTEENPYLINSVEDLEFFKASVNAGETKYNAAGVWVALAADIDLAGAVWTEAIGDGHNWSFDGNFDGKGYTIKNLNVVPYADEYGYVCGGLFGYLWGDVTIRNLVIENASINASAITGTSFNVGILAGFANKSNVTIENVTVKGDVKVDAANVYGVGGILGYDRSCTVTMTNCAIDANQGSYIKGYSFVGGIVGYSDNNATYTNCEVAGVEIIATSYSAGGIAGLVMSNNTVSGCEVASNVTVSASADAVNVANVVGSMAGDTVVVEDTTAAAPIVGGLYENNTPVQAAVGNVYYASFEKAFEALNDGETIVLLADVVLEEALTNTKNITIDLNGNVLSGVDTTTKNFGLINNNGTLTINATNGGAMVVSATVNSGWNRYSAVISNNPGGTLIVNGGKIQHLGGTDMAYAIDSLTNGNIGNVSVTINGGEIVSTYRAIRQFLNSATAENVLTVNGGTISGVNKAIFFHDPSTKANKGTLVIEGAATVEGGTYLYVTAGSTEWPVSVSIASGEVITANVPEQYALANNNGVYTVAPAVVTIDGVNYATLENAIAAAEDGDTITLLADIEVTATIKNTKDVTLDLNGKTISQSKACTASYEMIKNLGSLTITGNGTISFVDTSAGDPNFGWGSYTIRNEGTLVVENGTIEHKGAQAFATHMICAIFQYSGSTTINGGVIATPNYRSVRLWKGEMVINGGEFDGQVWVQAVDNSAKLTINGGTFEANGGDASSVFVSNSTYSVELSVTDGTFNGKIGCNNATALAGAITGGTFSQAAMNGTNVNLLNAGFIFAENADGTYGVERALSGAGTEANPYIINNVEDLEFFKASVNAGETKYNAAGVWVALAADIDLAGAVWARGIGDGINATFDGNFDGKDHTIKNLTMELTADSDGYLCGGLFGYTYGGVTIMNLVLENVTITTADAGHNVGALIGFAYNYGGKANVSDVTVNNLVMDTPKASGVGAIVGYSYGAMGTIANCTVDNATISGQTFVGGITGYSYTGAIIEGCSVSNATISASGNSAGGIAGLVLGGTTISDCTVVENVSVTAKAAGSVVGVIAANGIVVENCTTNEALPVVGGNYKDNKPVEAKIGNAFYATFAAAYDAAQAGDTITMFSSITVAAGETLVLDKDVTVSVMINATLTKSYALITNKGTLTIEAGTYSVNYTGASFGYGVGLYTISNEGGTLNVEGGRIENNTTVSGSMYDAIDNNSTLGDTIVNINSGEIYCSYLAIRQFANSTTKVNTVNVAGGKIEGGNSAIWTQNPGSKTPNANIVITGGTFNGRILLGESNNFEVAVSGGNFDQAVAEEFCVEGFIPTKNADGTYGVKVGTFAVQIGEAKYETLDAAFNAAKVGDTITLIANVVLEDGLYIAADKEITLDLAGYTLSQEKVQTAGYQMILNDGKLTIADSVGGGKISYTDKGNGGEYISDTIYNRAVLIINGGTIENLSDATVARNGYPHAVDTYTGSRNTSVTINDGTVYCANYSAIRMFCVSANYTADLVINGGTIKGAVDMQNGTKGAALGSLTINGGKFETTANANNVRFANWNGGATEFGITAAITGGDFNGGIQTTYVPATAGFNKKFITGGTFTQNMSEYCADGYALKANNGVYSVVAGYFYGANLTIGVDLSVNFYVNAVLDNAPEMKFTVDAENVSAQIAVGELVEINGVAMWKFTFKGVGPHLMGNTITASLIGGDLTIDYSVEAYAYAELRKTAVELGYNDEQLTVYRKFLVNLLNYGAASQSYNDKNNELAEADLVTADLTDAEKSLITHYHAVAPNAEPDVKPESGIVIGKMVVFGTANKIQILFKNEDGDNSIFENWTIKVYGNGNRGKKLTAQAHPRHAGYYYVEIDTILATEFNINYDVFFEDGNGNEYVVSYSIQTYVYNIQDQVDSEGNLTKDAELVRALWNYGYAANEYIGLFN